MQRWYRISLDAKDAPVNGWLLQTDDEPCLAGDRGGTERTDWPRSCTPPPSCEAVANGNRLTLFRCP